MNLGIVLSDQGKFDEAMDWLSRRIELRPDSADALQNIGMNLGRQGRWTEAIDYYEQALRQQPEFPEVHRNLAYALLCSRRLPARLARARMALEMRTLSRLSDQPHVLERRRPSGTNDPAARRARASAIPCSSFASRRWSSGEAAGSLVLCPDAAACNWSPAATGVDLAFDGSSFEPDCHVHAPLAESAGDLRHHAGDASRPRCRISATDDVLIEHWRSELARAIGDRCAERGANGADRRSLAGHASRS